MKMELNVWIKNSKFIAFLQGKKREEQRGSLHNYTNSKLECRDSFPNFKHSQDKPGLDTLLHMHPEWPQTLIGDKTFIHSIHDETSYS